MSSNKSWLQSGADYFADNRLWRIIAGGVMALIAFMVLWGYLAPARERNMVLNQGDILQHKGMSKEITDFRKAHNDEEPLWTNGMFGGMPTYQISTWYPNNLMQKLDNILNLRGMVPTPIGNLFILFLGLFILLRSLKVDPVSAAVGCIWVHDVLLLLHRDRGRPQLQGECGRLPPHGAGRRALPVPWPLLARPRSHDLGDGP